MRRVTAKTVGWLTCAWVAGLLLGSGVQTAGAAQLGLTLPLGRHAYQTNERIDLLLTRSASNAPLPAATLDLALTADDGSRMAFAFPLRAAAADSNGLARATEYLHLNGAMLRPGRYTVTVACAAATSSVPIEVHSHVRKSTFVICDWNHGGPGDQLQRIGEDSLGYNLTFKTSGIGDATIRGGLNYMRGMALGGAHQLDGNLKNDWSDPYVLREGRLRATRQALRDRTQPNCIGVHFYDEPGLTWNEHPETKVFGPFNIAAQDRAWEGCYGEPAQQYHQVAATDPASQARWREQNLWKLRFMEAAWRDISTGVNLVRPDWLTATQSQYGWDAFSDGYYFNIARRLPVIAGHGWYSDCYWLNLAPAMASEFGRLRDWNRPLWYMPTWWDMNLAHSRMEQAMSFAQNLQGMMWPVGAPWAPSTTQGMEGIVEMNQAMLRLGPVFTTLPVDRAPVALLYSVSQGIEAQIRSGMKDFRAANGHPYTTEAFYAAGMRNQIPLFPVVVEDILDGQLAANHQAIILSKVEYLPPAVISALEDYVASGGKALLDNECTVAVQGATKLGLQRDPAFNDLTASDRATYTSHNFMRLVEPLAKDLRKKLVALGVNPVFACDSLDILGRRQAQGDVEYLFAVNIRTDGEIEWQNTVRGTTATIGVPDDGRPLYDALRGGEAAGFERKGKELAATLRFGPGQMRIWARTARPIGGVEVAPVRVRREYADAPRMPVLVDCAATLVDADRRVLDASAPLRVRLIDPLGDVRNDLYRATDRGALRLTLPLAANDPEGEWTVEVTDLLAGHVGRQTFRLEQPRLAGAVAGLAHRALMLGEDSDRTFDFFRRHREVLLVTGSSPYNAQAAAQLATNLTLWGVASKVVAAADVKPRTVPEAARKLNLSWENGFDIAQPCVLLGSPQDNPLIRFMVDGARTAMLPPTCMLPYRPAPDALPGRGRGLVAWQLDVVAHGVESLTCVAYDAAGMREAVGSLFEAASGLAPLTEWVLPVHSRVTPATVRRQVLPDLEVAWKGQVPDRAIDMAAFEDGRVGVASYDGTLTMFDQAGRKLWEKSTDRSGEYMCSAASADGRTFVISAGFSIVGFDGQTGKPLFDVKAYPDDRKLFVRSLAVSADGETVFAGTQDSCVLALDRKGKSRWFTMEPAGKVYVQELDRFRAAMKEWERKKDEKAPKPALPAAVPLFRYTRLVLSADGKTLLAAAANGSHLYQVDNGALLGAVAGVNGTYPIVADGDGFLAHDGQKNLQRVSVAEKKVVKSLPLAGTQLVGLARQGDGWLLGTESDGTVRRVGSLADKLDGAVAWAHTADTRIVKQVLAVGDATVVIYWGGTVKVLDPGGAVKAESLFSPDFSATAVAGDVLYGTLADGRVVAMNVKPGPR